MKTEKFDFLLSMKIDTLVKEKIKNQSIPINFGNHFRSQGSNLDRMSHYLDGGLFGFILHKTKQEANKLLKAIETNQPTDWFSCHTSNFFRCSECEEKIALEFNGVSFRCKNPCKYPKGFPAYDFYLNVPSGKIVVANDLREYFPIVGDYNVNLTSNCKRTSDKYASVGMAHAFVGNTCPNVYKINDHKFVVGTQSSKSNNPVKGSRRVASICTDLWWFSIVDYDQFLIRAKRKPEGHWEQIVDVKPGVYRFRHQYHLCENDDYKKASIYTYIDRIRKPDPVIDYQAQWDSLNFTAGQIIHGMLTGEYSDLYLTKLDFDKLIKKNLAKTDSIARAADSLLCTLGSGRDYHHNGWYGSDPDLTIDAPDLKIPIFKKKYHWYTWDINSSIPAGAGIGKDRFKDKTPNDLYFNPSFVNLACNICQCIIRYGVDSPHYTGDEKAMQKLSLRCLKAFAKKYPNDFPDYCKDLI